jgi:hypothetical protein
MAEGLGLAGGFGAAAADDAIQGVLAQKRLEQIQQAALQRQLEQDARQQQLDVENRRRFDLTWQRTQQQDAIAGVERAREAAARDAGQKFLRGVLVNPAIPEAARTLLQLGQHGLGSNLNVHALESPEAHTAHTGAERDAEFTDWTRQQDYLEQQRRSRPVRTTAGNLRLLQDDPSFPRGVQAYMLQLRTKHPSFESAAGELTRQLATLHASHPTLSPQKAVNALRQLFTGSGGAATGDDVVSSAVEAAMSGVLGGGDPSSGPAENDQMEAQLRERARAAIQQRLGRDPSDEEITKVLANPNNRRKLMGAR